MSKVSIFTKQDQIGEALEAMVKRTRSPKAYFQTVVYKQYVEAQKHRWVSENVTETGQWVDYKDGHDGRYARWKREKFSSFPGGGTKMGVLRGTLLQTAINENNKLHKVIDDHSITLSIKDSDVPHAKYFAEKRDVMTFGKQTIEYIKRGLIRYISKGDLHE